jgi:ABC-type microcin C transport system permease subunit YejB
MVLAVSAYNTVNSSVWSLALPVALKMVGLAAVVVVLNVLSPLIRVVRVVWVVAAMAGGTDAVV